MAPYGSDDTTTADENDDLRSGRRKAARYVVPVAVVGVAAATIGLVPALASSGDPDLPEISAEQLIEKIAESDVEQLSGTVKISTDLGLPDLGGLESALTSGALGSGEGGSSADPSTKLTELVSGSHTLRVAADGPDRQKISLLGKASEYSLIHNGKDVWGYDSETNEVFHGTAEESGKHEEEVPATPKDFAEEALKAVDDTTSVTVDGTAHVAGRDAYRLLIKPKQSGTTVGAITVAVDARTGMPLKFTLTPSSGGAAVIDAGFTQVSFAKPDDSTFDFTPPKGAKITEEDEAVEEGRAGRAPGEKPGHDTPEGDLPEGEPRVIGEGWNAVAVLETGGEGIPSGDELEGDLGPFGDFIDSFGDKAKGKFGEGRIFTTRLVNALVTDDGKVYVGAVTKDALVKAANAG
ncbi:DUF2092 domain-containing protein [Streptomyces sp. FZ201]|uniref:LolA family protein n=1 Tax=Streptomyces sp. FZ201 TaxID=3057122 RepID=UPI0021BFFF9C|nr:DUF2092 domain-containing protein [Streptomyces sp. FZ201]